MSNVKGLRLRVSERGRSLFRLPSVSRLETKSQRLRSKVKDNVKCQVSNVRSATLGNASWALALGSVATEASACVEQRSKKCQRSKVKGKIGFLSKTEVFLLSGHKREAWRQR